MPRKQTLTITIAFLALTATFCQPAPATDPGLIARDIYRMNRQQIIDAVGMNFRKHEYSGLPAGEIAEIHIFDLDHTLVDTRTLIPYQTAAAGSADGSKEDEAAENLLSSDSKCMTVGPTDRADYSVFTREALFESPPVAAGLAELHDAAATGAPIFVVTSRGGSHNFTSIPEYLAREKVRVNGVFPVNSRFLGKHLWKNQVMPAGIKQTPGGMKKPFIIAALIDLARQQGAWPQRVVYHDDTDKHFRGSMVLLGLMFPEIQFELIDYVREKRGRDFVYTRRPAARSRDGQWFTFAGQAIADGRQYDSGDCPEQKPYPPLQYR